MDQKTRNRSKKAPMWASSRVLKRTLKKAKKERREVKMIKVQVAMLAMESISSNSRKTWIKIQKTTITRGTGTTLNQDLKLSSRPTQRDSHSWRERRDSTRICARRDAVAVMSQTGALARRNRLIMLSSTPPAPQTVMKRLWRAKIRMQKSIKSTLPLSAAGSTKARRTKGQRGPTPRRTKTLSKWSKTRRRTRLIARQRGSSTRTMSKCRATSKAIRSKKSKAWSATRKCWAKRRTASSFNSCASSPGGPIQTNPVNSQWTQRRATTRWGSKHLDNW